MSILYVEAKRKRKCGLFSWEKPKYAPIICSYKEFETEDEAKKAFDTIDNWLVVDVLSGIKYRIWSETMTLWCGTMRPSKTCYVGDIQYSAFLL